MGPQERRCVLRETDTLCTVMAIRSGLSASFADGTANFEVMREWNRSVVYRKTMVLFAEQLVAS
jgi:membrane-bound lytic murein transglycosylase B